MTKLFWKYKYWEYTKNVKMFVVIVHNSFAYVEESDLDLLLVEIIWQNIEETVICFSISHMYQRNIGEQVVGMIRKTYRKFSKQVVLFWI